MLTLYKCSIAAGALAGFIWGCTPAFAGGGFMAGFGAGLYDYSNQLNQQAYQEELLRLQQENLRLQQQYHYVAPSTVTNCWWYAGIQTCRSN